MTATAAAVAVFFGAYPLPLLAQVGLHGSPAAAEGRSASPQAETPSAPYSERNRAQPSLSIFLKGQGGSPRSRPGPAGRGSHRFAAPRPANRSRACPTVKASRSTSSVVARTPRCDDRPQSMSAGSPSQHLMRAERPQGFSTPSAPGASPSLQMLVPEAFAFRDADELQRLSAQLRCAGARQG